MIVSDSGPLIAFARVGRLDLLHEAVGEVCIPEAVYQELVVKGHGKPGSKEIEDSSWITRHRVAEAPATFSSQGLQHGEIEAIALAKQLGLLLLIDDRLGREAAQRAGVAVAGSLAVLGQAKRLGLLSEVAPLLLEIMNVGHRIDGDLASAFLAELGET